MVTKVSFGKREKSERRRRRKCWVMNYRADHFRLTPEREGGGGRGGSSSGAAPCLVCGKPPGGAIYGQLKQQRRLTSVGRQRAAP